MNEKRNGLTGHLRMFRMPVLLAIPFVILLVIAVICWGGILRNVIHVLIKAVVIA